MNQRIRRAHLCIGIALLLMAGVASAVAPQLEAADKDGNPLMVQRNPETGTAHRIYGLKTRVDEYGFDPRAKSSWSVEELTAAVLHDYQKLLRVDPAQLEIERVDSDGEMLFVDLRQIVDGLPVHGADAGYTIDKNGYLVALGADTFQRIDLVTTPTLRGQWAREQAAALFDAEDSSLMAKPQLVVYPTEQNGKQVFVHAWKVVLRSTRPPRAELFFINAEDGTLIERIDYLRSGFPVPPPVIPLISGTIKGRYWPEHDYDTVVTTGFATKGIAIKNSSGSTVKSGNTSSTGVYSISLSGLSNGTYNAVVPLRTAYIRVLDADGDPITSSYSFYFSGGATLYNKTWSASDASNVRYHANRIHDYYKNTLGFSLMDYLMDGYVDQGAFTNGAADGEDIFFGSEDGENWARSSDVVYHEYTHNTIHHIYSDWIGYPDYFSQGAAMDEGLSDYFACTLNNDSVQGESVGVSRNLSNTLSWDENLGAHANGRVIGGACWDVRTSCGATVANLLVFRSMQLTPRPHNFLDFLENMIVADENYYSGSHVHDIQVAFGNHHIAPPLVVSISGPSSLSYPSTGTWTASAEGGVPSYSYQWYYRYPESKSGTAKEVTPGPDISWLPLGTGSSLTHTDSSDFELLCMATDSISTRSSSNTIFVNVN